MSPNDNDPIGRANQPRAAGDGLRAGVDRPFTQADYERIMGRPPGPQSDAEYRTFRRQVDRSKLRLLGRMLLRSLFRRMKRKPLVPALVGLALAALVWHWIA